MNINNTQSLKKLLLSAEERRFGKARLNKMKGKKQNKRMGSKERGR